MISTVHLNLEFNYAQELDRDYAPGELEATETWITPIFEPVRLSYMVEPFVLQICLPEGALPGGAAACSTYLVDCDSLN
jgi:hypothetical protein